MLYKKRLEVINVKSYKLNVNFLLESDWLIKAVLLSVVCITKKDLTYYSRRRFCFMIILLLT